MPSAAVRMITPASSGTIRSMIDLSRRRSVSGSLREIPVAPPPGTYTTNRPGSEIWVVSRAPLCPTGSFDTWARMVSPLDSAVSIRRALPPSPAASQLTSPA